MKTAASALAAALFILAAISCGKHSWEQTQSLHEGMHKGHGTDAKHDEHPKAGDSHGKIEEHAPIKH